jgi:general stress protein 26
MSADATTNTSTGNHPVDPYKSKNFEDPPLPQKIEDLTTFISQVKFGMLTTKQSDGDYLASRCMALAAQVWHFQTSIYSNIKQSHVLTSVPTQENGGIDLIFHTNLFSGKAMDLAAHPQETNMSFLDPSSGAWASISGTASIISDSETVEKYYSPMLKAWIGDMGDGVHDGGPKDPRIGVIRLEAKLATHNVTHKGLLGRAYDTVKGAVQGNVPSINGIRELTKEELAECMSIVPSLCGLNYTDLFLGRRTHKE